MMTRTEEAWIPAPELKQAQAWAETGWMQAALIKVSRASRNLPCSRSGITTGYAARTAH